MKEVSVYVSDFKDNKYKVTVNVTIDGVTLSPVLQFVADIVTLSENAHDSVDVANSVFED